MTHELLLNADMPVVATSLAAAVGSVGAKSTGRTLARPAEVNLLPGENPVDEESRNARTDSTESTLRSPANSVWMQLVPGKKYETRPAPFGGY